MHNSNRCTYFLFLKIMLKRRQITHNKTDAVFKTRIIMATYNGSGLITAWGKSSGGAAPGHRILTGSKCTIPVYFHYIDVDTIHV